MYRIYSYPKQNIYLTVILGITCTLARLQRKYKNVVIEGNNVYFRNANNTLSLIASKDTNIP